MASLPGWVKVTHAVALAAIALSVVLLMTPAALHRIAYDGDNSHSFFRISSALVVAAAFPLLSVSPRTFAWGRSKMAHRWRAACFADGLRIFADPRNVLVLLSALAAPCQRSALLTPWASSKRRSVPTPLISASTCSACFSDEGPWPMAWMPRVTPKVEQVVARAPERTIFTRFIHSEKAAGCAYGRWRACLTKLVPCNPPPA